MLQIKAAARIARMPTGMPCDAMDCKSFQANSSTAERQHITPINRFDVIFSCRKITPMTREKNGIVYARRAARPAGSKLTASAEK